MPHREQPPGGHEPGEQQKELRIDAVLENHDKKRDPEGYERVLNEAESLIQHCNSLEIQLLLQRKVIHETVLERLVIERYIDRVSDKRDQMLQALARLKEEGFIKY